MTRESEDGVGRADLRRSEDACTKRKLIPAPKKGGLPLAINCAVRSGTELSTISVKLKVVTPILGGAPVTRTIDDIDVIRAPTVRGHLRFWWRALYGHDYCDAAELFKAESEMWGRAASEEGGRSTVDVAVQIHALAEVDASAVQLYSSRGQQMTPGAYALWPAKDQAEDRRRARPYVPTAPRRAPGTLFELRIQGPKKSEPVLRNVVRAWSLFGGYGSRTRRGLGSLTVVDDIGNWLPTAATRTALTGLFGRDLFASAGKPTIQTPLIAGAALCVGKAVGNAQNAWTAALDSYLKEYRQGTASGARQSGMGKQQPNRPSLSNWPEADAVRRIATISGRGPFAHYPRPGYGPGRAWPRASFGLPIVGQFQKQARGDGPGYNEPDNFELRWHDGFKERDRLASPLVIKALPLANGLFVPCALWLNRAYPSGQVVLRGLPPASSGAEFDTRFGVPATAPNLIRAAGSGPMRDAFLNWLKSRPDVTVVAP